MNNWLCRDAQSWYKIPRGCRHIVSPSLKLKRSLKTLSVIGKNKHVIKRTIIEERFRAFLKKSLCLSFLIYDAGSIEIQFNNNNNYKNNNNFYLINKIHIESYKSH